MSAEQQIQTCLEALQALSITVDSTHRVTHPAVMKAPEHLEALKQFPSFPSAILVKNLFVKEKKTDQLILIVAKHDSNCDLKSVQKILGLKNEIRFASEDLLLTALGVAPGSVTPLAVMNDKENKVMLVMEKSLSEATLPIIVHPLTNTASIVLSYDSINRFVTQHNHQITMLDLSAVPAAAPKPESKPKADKAAKPVKQAKPAPAAGEKSGKDAFGIDRKKNGEFALWYSQVVTRGELIEYYDISGCYILRPWSFAIWEGIQQWFDKSIKKLGVKNAYFPLFVSKRALEKEKDHVEGFAPEVAWVTKSGDSDLQEPIAVRPTSETIMYPAFAKWIRSHRDLPLKLNQWSNVVRWEFKFPTPFIRSREFLWQEGHTAFATKAEADEEVLQILDLYSKVYEELLAVPVTKGKKTEMEKFAGGLYTTTVEAFIPATGRGIQGATSHCLGQNFAKMNDITFQDDSVLEKDATGKGQKKSHYVWQNSWGCTTRTIGVMVMIHSDDKGLVLPPRVAPTQVVMIPIYRKENKDAVIAKCHELASTMIDSKYDIRVEVDDRDNYNPGWKFNHWELKGVCLRMEIGQSELDSNSVRVHRRDLDDKTKDVTLSVSNLSEDVNNMLITMHSDMLNKARREMTDKRKVVTEWRDFTRALDARCTALAPHCEDKTCEKDIKNRTAEAAVDEEEQANDHAETGVEKLTGAAKSLCIPFEQPELKEGQKCVGCNQAAKNWTLFGRSY